MSSQNATTAPQPSSNIKHDPIPLEAIGLFLVLLLMAISALKWYVGVGIIVAGYMYIRHVKAVEALKEAKARAAAYANHIWPVVVGSKTPDEPVTEVAARAEEWRQKLVISGNRWAEKIPVIEYPYDPIISDGVINEAFSMYELRLADYRKQLFREWHSKCPKEMQHLYASSVFTAPNQEQQPQ